MSQKTKQTCCSCPGKVLIAGGYLVLEKPNVGLVVATSSRFYSLVKSLADQSGPTGFVTVKSPQFLQAEWTYEVSKDGSCTQTNVATAGRNPFVEIALKAALTLAAQMDHPLADSLEIVIVGDNDFYSQDDSANLDAAVKPFQQLNCTLSAVHKTGLGSSAAMVTSLVAALLHHLFPSVSRELTHNLAQYAHSLAQGKVGSGFDVSSAMYGSHIYTRFDPSCFGDLMDAGDTIPTTLLQTLSPTSNPAWSSQKGAQSQAFALPPYTSLLLADVNAGSNTPSMVGKVLQWRKANPEEANALWKEIATVNERLAGCLRGLQEVYAAGQQQYTQAVEYLAKERFDQVEKDAPRVRSTFLKTYNTMKDFRSNMTKMGQLANVPIEPQEQTRLVDACQALPGVIGGGVPGAGGYDALYVLVLSPPSDPQVVQKSVQSLWKEWKEMQVKPLSEAAYVHGYAANERTTDMEGLRIEQVDQVAGLAEVAS